jgi:hypothetical protein
MEDRPLILTVQLNEEAFRFFNTLRQQFFPPERNFLSAHLTLFHHLPPNEPNILDEITLQANNNGVLNLAVTDVVSIGKGVAYKIDCPPLQILHKQLQTKWQPWLTPQDRQKLWPHITIQNKVTPAVAQQTLLQVKNGFEAFTAIGTGLSLWAYEGGPWKALHHFPFKTSLA